MGKKMSREALRQRIARLSGRVAANKRIATPGYDGLEATSAARSTYWAALEAEVDPGMELSTEERHEKAVRLWRSRMDQAKLAKAQRQLKHTPHTRAA